MRGRAGRAARRRTEGERNLLASKFEVFALINHRRSAAELRGEEKPQKLELLRGGENGWDLELVTRPNGDTMN